MFGDGGGLLRERSRRVPHVRGQNGGTPCGPGFDVGVPRFLALVHWDLRAGACPAQEMSEPIRVACNMGENVTAGPSGQQGGFASLPIAEPGNGREQALGRGLDACQRLADLVHGCSFAVAWRQGAPGHPPAPLIAQKAAPGNAVRTVVQLLAAIADPAKSELPDDCRRKLVIEW